MKVNPEKEQTQIQEMNEELEDQIEEEMEQDQLDEVIKENRSELMKKDIKEQTEEKQTESNQKIDEVRLEPSEYDENSKEVVKKSGKGFVAKLKRFKKICSLKLGRS